VTPDDRRYWRHEGARTGQVLQGLGPLVRPAQTMTEGKHSKEVKSRHIVVDDVFAAIEAHQSGVAMALLWTMPVLGFLVALVRTLR
jgi:hypothetical protein